MPKGLDALFKPVGGWRWQERLGQGGLTLSKAWAPDFLPGGPSQPAVPGPPP